MCVLFATHSQVAQCAIYEDPGATATDNIDPPESLQIVTTGVPIDTSILGIATITYDVEDSDGNNAVTKTRLVDVVAEGSVCPDATPGPIAQPVPEPASMDISGPVLTPTPEPAPAPVVDTEPPVITVLGKVLKQFNQVG